MNNTLTKEIVGNLPALQFIEKVAALGRNNYLSDSYILTGYDPRVSLMAANWLFKALACLDKLAWPCDDCLHCHQIASGSFPDFYQISIEADKRNIGIEQIKEMIGRLGLSSFTNNYRFVLINNAESLSLSAANSLLKTLEEPGARIVIVLLASDINNLPATIVSRSQVVHFRQVSSDLLFDYLMKQEGMKRSLAKSIARLSLGSFGAAERYLKNEQLYNSRVESATAFALVLDADLNQRLKYAQTIVDKKSEVSGLQDLVALWQSVIRDLLLLNLNQPDLIANDSLRGLLNERRMNFGIKRLVEANKSLAALRTNLAANVNPQMALENALINI